MLEPIGQRCMAGLVATPGCLGFAMRLNAIQNLLDDAGREYKVPAWRDLEHVMLGQSHDDGSGLEGVIPLLQQPTHA